MLFDSICNSQWFQKTSIILFLNKVDVFKERILVSSIRAYFPDYEGDDTDYNAAREYFKARFTRLNRSQSKEICKSRHLTGPAAEHRITLRSSCMIGEHSHSRSPHEETAADCRSVPQTPILRLPLIQTLSGLSCCRSPTSSSIGSSAMRSRPSPTLTSISTA